LNTVLSRTLDGDLRNSSEWLLHFEDWVLVRSFGAGGFGVVNAIAASSTDRRSQSKTSEYGSSLGSTDEGGLDRASLLFVREVEIMRRLGHPCVVKLKEISSPTDTGPAQVASEFTAGRSLDGVLTGQPS
jgi:serine/threonine protein kinase